MIDQERVLEAFRQRFGRPTAIVGRAPGRVNLIGEHTDYNGGFVLPSAVNRDVVMALAPRDDGNIRLHSLNYGEAETIPDVEKGPIPKRATGWANYVVAVVEQLRARKASVHGFDGLLAGDVPDGAGLSSSAAVEMAVGIGLEALWELAIPKKQLALLGQAAEHSDYVGVKCGIMDQFISALGRADHALLIDCDSLDFESVPIPPSLISILIVNSMVKRGLVDSEYNRRRKECADGLAILSEKENREFPTLRHAGLEVFRAHEKALPDPIRRRVRHVVTENERVHAAAAALRRGDVSRVGALFTESHSSLRDDYAVSCPPLDRLCALLEAEEGVYGARITGAGFGGCVVALVDPKAAQIVADSVARRYEGETGKQPDTFITPASDGARAISLERQST